MFFQNNEIGSWLMVQVLFRSDKVDPFQYHLGIEVARHKVPQSNNLKIINTHYLLPNNQLLIHMFDN
jgi:hypothetical protein